MKNNNITLIGMPAAGKSTVGSILAEALGYDFVDVDRLIEAHEGMLLQEILDAHGQEYFRQVEDEVNAAIETERTVLAPGGSIIYCPDGIEHLRDIGEVIYLKVPYETIEERCTNMGDRGINMGPDQTLQDLYDERIPLYEKYAHLTVEPEERNAVETMEMIRELLESLDFFD